MFVYPFYLISNIDFAEISNSDVHLSFPVNLNIDFKENLKSRCYTIVQIPR